MHHAFKLGEREYEVELSRSADAYRLHADDGIVVSVQIGTGDDGRARLTVDDIAYDIVTAEHGDDVFVHLDGEAYQLRYEHPLVRLAAAGAGSADDSVRAPMPGSIVSVAVKAGDAVTKGQTLLVMESMKMETTIISPRDGVVATLNFAQGQTFDRDALLLTMEIGA